MFYNIFCSIFSQPVKRQNPAICFCYFHTEGRLHLWNLLGWRCDMFYFVSKNYLRAKIEPKRKYEWLRAKPSDGAESFSRSADKFFYLHNRQQRIQSLKIVEETSDKNKYFYILNLFLKLTWPVRHGLTRSIETLIIFLMPRICLYNRTVRETKVRGIFVSITV